MGTEPIRNLTLVLTLTMMTLSVNILKSMYFFQASFATLYVSAPLRLCIAEKHIHSNF